MDLVNINLLKNPANWFVVWTMVLIGWFLFKTINRNLPNNGN